MGRHSSDESDGSYHHRGQRKSRDVSEERKRLKKSHKSHHFDSHRSSSRTGEKKHGHRRSRSRSSTHEPRDSRRKASRKDSSRSSSRQRSRSRDRNVDSRGSSTVSSHARSHVTEAAVPASLIAERKLQLALKAAAAADEALKAQGVLLSSSLKLPTLAEQQQRAAAIDSIDNDEFVQSSFRSNRNEIPMPSGSSVDASHAGAMFSSSSRVTSQPIRAFPASVIDKDSLMHPNLYIGAEEKMENWKVKLATWRRNKLVETGGVRP